MQLRVLAVGDVVGDCGVEFLHRHLPALRKLHEVHFTVVNGENAACNGLLPRQAEEIFAAGADVITMGNHTWDKQQITAYMDNSRYLIRPANYTRRALGRGWGIFDGPRGLRIRVVNLIGRCEMDANFDNPFFKMDEILAQDEADVTLVDFHGEATSERGPWLGIWTAESRLCGALTPMCPPPMVRCCPKGWALSPTWA